MSGDEPADPAARAYEAMRQISGGSGAGTTRRPVRRRKTRKGDDSWSGARPDPRDPQPLGSIVEGVVRDQGWSSDVVRGQVLGTWDRLVGPAVAAHVRPVSLEDGVLVVVADSTAWATQFGLLSRQVIRTVNDSVRPSVGPTARTGNGGRDVVLRITVRGPSVPSWKSGPRSVRGRGPRDTYG